MTMILTSRYLSPNDCNIVVKHGHHAHSSHFMLEIRPLAPDTITKVVRRTDEIAIGISSTQLATLPWLGFSIGYATSSPLMARYVQCLVR